MILASIAIPAYDYVGNTNKLISEQQTTIQSLNKSLKDSTDTLDLVTTEMTKQEKIIAEQRSDIAELKKHQATPSRSEPKGRQYKITLDTVAYSWTGGRTCTGVWPKVGTIAVDPKIIPLGSKIYVPGYGYGIAEDTGGAIHGHIIDLFMGSYDDSVRWGRKKLTVTVFDKE